MQDNDFGGPYSVPGQPTDAGPGSEKKIRVMIERASRREALFHPQDGIRQRRRVPLDAFVQGFRLPGSESA